MNGRPPLAHRPTVLLLVGALALALLALPAAAKKKDDKYLEWFSANAHSLVAGKTSRVEIGISRWSTPEERQTLLEAVKNTGQEDFQRILRREFEKMPLCGFFRFTNSMAVNVRYTRQVATEEGRQVLLVAERPILPSEASSNFQTMEHALSIIVLKLNDEDKGEGTLAMGVEIIYNDKTDTIELKNLATQPIRLINVRKR
jgi:hypothetical protein